MAVTRSKGDTGAQRHRGRETQGHRDMATQTDTMRLKRNDRVFQTQSKWDTEAQRHRHAY